MTPLQIITCKQWILYRNIDDFLKFGNWHQQQPKINDLFLMQLNDGKRKKMKNKLSANYFYNASHAKRSKTFCFVSFGWRISSVHLTFPLLSVKRKCTNQLRWSPWHWEKEKKVDWTVPRSFGARTPNILLLLNRVSRNSKYLHGDDTIHIYIWAVVEFADTTPIELQCRNALILKKMYQEWQKSTDFNTEQRTVNNWKWTWFSIPGQIQ